MLAIVGEKTSMIYLGCFVVTSALTHIMAHTAVAATIYPLLVAIYALYGEGDKQTRFGKGFLSGWPTWRVPAVSSPSWVPPGAQWPWVFIPISSGNDFILQLTYYMFPVGWIMTFLLWGFFMIFFKPEKATIPGLREKAKRLYKELGPLTRNEIVATTIVGACILTMSLRSFVPILQPVDKTGIILISTILFFITGILDIDDLESVPWNIILLFAGAMSIGFCLWETGAAKWLAVNWLACSRKPTGLSSP